MLFKSVIVFCFVFSVKQQNIFRLLTEMNERFIDIKQINQCVKKIVRFLVYLLFFLTLTDKFL